MSVKRGNDRERQRHRIEDKIIEQIDRISEQNPPYPEHGPLRIPIIDLLVYNATTSNRPIKACGV